MKRRDLFKAMAGIAAAPVAVSALPPKPEELTVTDNGIQWISMNDARINSYHVSDSPIYCRSVYVTADGHLMGAED